MKIAALAFLAVCIAARAFRSKVAPFLARLFPQPATPTKGTAQVETLTTHELASVLVSRIQADAQAEAQRATEADLVKRFAAVAEAKPADPKA